MIHYFLHKCAKNFGSLTLPQQALCQNSTGYLWANTILCWIAYGLSSSTCFKLAESTKLAQAPHHMSVPDPAEM